MKKLIMALAILCSTIGYSQETEDSQDILRKNEFKINMTNLIIFKWVDVSYERILNEESTFGVGTLFSLDQDYNDDVLDEYRTFSITLYYRHFFSKKYAQGFFVEGFGMLHSGKDGYFIYSDFTNYEDKYTDFAVGISAGAKFVTKRGFVAEIYLGIGRDLLGNSDIEVVGRGGIAIGYRF
jgi:hypothetical protein